MRFAFTTRCGSVWITRAWFGSGYRTFVLVHRAVTVLLVYRYVLAVRSWLPHLFGYAVYAVALPAVLPLRLVTAVHFTVLPLRTHPRIRLFIPYAAVGLPVYVTYAVATAFPVGSVRYIPTRLLRLRGLRVRTGSLPAFIRTRVYRMPRSAGAGYTYRVYVPHTARAPALYRVTYRHTPAGYTHTAHGYAHTRLRFRLLLRGLHIPPPVLRTFGYGCCTRTRYRTLPPRFDFVRLLPVTCRFGCSYVPAARLRFRLYALPGYRVWFGCHPADYVLGLILPHTAVRFATFGHYAVYAVTFYGLPRSVPGLRSGYGLRWLLLPLRLRLLHCSGLPLRSGYHTAFRSTVWLHAFRLLPPLPLPVLRLHTFTFCCVLPATAPYYGYRCRLVVPLPVRYYTFLRSAYTPLPVTVPAFYTWLRSTFIYALRLPCYRCYGLRFAWFALYAARLGYVYGCRTYAHFAHTGLPLPFWFILFTVCGYTRGYVGSGLCRLFAVGLRLRFTFAFGCCVCTVTQLRCHGYAHARHARTPRLQFTCGCCHAFVVPPLLRFITVACHRSSGLLVGLITAVRGSLPPLPRSTRLRSVPHHCVCILLHHTGSRTHTCLRFTGYRLRLLLPAHLDYPSVWLVAGLPDACVRGSLRLVYVALHWVVHLVPFYTLRLRSAVAVTVWFTHAVAVVPYLYGSFTHYHRYHHYRNVPLLRFAVHNTFTHTHLVPGSAYCLPPLPVTRSPGCTAYLPTPACLAARGWVLGFFGYVYLYTLRLHRLPHFRYYVRFLRPHARLRLVHLHRFFTHAHCLIAVGSFWVTTRLRCRCYRAAFYTWIATTFIANVGYGCSFLPLPFTG